MGRIAFILGLDSIVSNLPELHARAIAEVLHRHTIVPAHLVEETAADILMRFADKSSKFIFETMVEQAKKTHCTPPPEVLRQEKWDMLAGASGCDFRTREDAAGFVKRLHQRHMPLAIATAAPRSFAERVLEATRLRACFSVVVSVRDREIAKSKPAPDVLEHAAGMLGVAQTHCIVVAHRESDIAAARAAGMHTLACVGTAAAAYADWVTDDLSQWEIPEQCAV